MLLTLMLFAMPVGPDPETAVDAERAFNRSAQIDGQWTAFRKFSTPDALLFTPQPMKAHDILPTRNPPIAVQWWPAESYVSCDGMVAVNSGPWVRPREVGYFTTVWVRQPDGHFKWVYDGGDALAKPRPLPEKPMVRTAACSPLPPAVAEVTTAGGTAGHGQSPDGTLRWFWRVEPNGARHFIASLWTGKVFETVLTNYVAAPK
ncbi:MAG: hypothetical protein ACAH11_10880 [Sphingomonas sp.]